MSHEVMDCIAKAVVNTRMILFIIFIVGVIVLSFFCLIDVCDPTTFS